MNACNPDTGLSTSTRLSHMCWRDVVQPSGLTSEDCAPHLELSNRTRTVGLPQRQAGGIWMLGMGICNHESSGRHVTAHRSRALQHHWRGQLYESFLQDMYQVLKEVLSPDVGIEYYTT